MKKGLTVLLLLCLLSTGTAGCADRSGSKSAGGVDVDLTVLSGTMVYAEVFNILENPDDYLGKTIRAKGPYAASWYEGGYYHFLIIEDASSCCAEGLMFIWSGGHSYPDDYPEERTNIEITGVFNRYEGFDFPYYYLAVDELAVL